MWDVQPVISTMALIQVIRQVQIVIEIEFSNLMVPLIAVLG